MCPCSFLVSRQQISCKTAKTRLNFRTYLNWWKMPKFEKFKCDILSNFQTMWRFFSMIFNVQYYHPRFYDLRSPFFVVLKADVHQCQLSFFLLSNVDRIEKVWWSSPQDDHQDRQDLQEAFRIKITGFNSRTLSLF